MLFSEVYGTYYNILAKLLGHAVEGTLTKEAMYSIIREKGFEESILTIAQALEDQTWPLLKDDLTTPLQHAPTMPLTTLQKRWLKALLNDPRIRLFAPDATGLEDVEPLYPPDVFVYYDRYHDGDPFDNPDYIRNFRCILRAIKEKRRLCIRFTGGKGIDHTWVCIPHKLEYSAKDDKFRLITAGKRDTSSINLARISGCHILRRYNEADFCAWELAKEQLVLELTDERNALERAMLHFSHLDKETERIADDRYRITLHYEAEDETELLIRVLSFGPVLKVVSPSDFVKKLRERLEKQKNLRTWK